MKLVSKLVSKRVPKGTTNPTERPSIVDQLPKRGYHAVYRRGSINHCPGCGGTQWWIGTTNATCAFENCGLALELGDEVRRGEASTVARNLHIPERRPANPGVPTIFRQNFHVPTRRIMGSNVA